MSQNCFWFAPPPWRKNSARRRRRRSKFVWKNGGKSVGGALRRPQFGLWKTVKFYSGVSILPSSHLFSKSLNEWISPTTARSARVSRKKMFSAILFCARPIFSSKRMRTFFAGLCPQWIGQVVGLQCGLGFAKLFFWGFGFGKTETECSRPQEGSGEECGRDFASGFFSGGCKKEPKTAKIKKLWNSYEISKI